MSTVDSSNGADAMPSGKWSLDATRSSVAFAMKHMIFATVDGRFREFDGTLELGEDAPRASGVVQAASIDTNEPVRDEHVRQSPDFFDVERYPEIGFNSTRIDYLGGGQLHIRGELTMRGVTREIELDGQLDSARSEPRGDERIELTLRGELNRRDFGLVWNQALETGGALLGNKVKIVLALSVVRLDAA
ncbi:MAG TPA: YceI family protein [Solirubrobacteraceae bacterium]|nr:YceI family protein [Solirubrobacteraceae bacterium]